MTPFADLYITNFTSFIEKPHSEDPSDDIRGDGVKEKERWKARRGPTSASLKERLGAVTRSRSRISNEGIVNSSGCVGSRRDLATEQ